MRVWSIALLVFALVSIVSVFAYDAPIVGYERYLKEINDGNTAYWVNEPVYGESPWIVEIGRDYGVWVLCLSLVGLGYSFSDKSDENQYP